LGVSDIVEAAWVGFGLQVDDLLWGAELGEVLGYFSVAFFEARGCVAFFSGAVEAEAGFGVQVAIGTSEPDECAG